MASFTYSEIDNLDAYYSRLTQEALLLISGPDSLKFLQGQTTCDTDQIDESHALHGAYCNPQGRMVCDFLLARLGADLYGLRMKRDILESAAVTLGKYIVFSKADLITDDKNWELAACWGSAAGQALGSIFPALPEGRLQCVSGDDFLLVQIDGAGEQYECFLNTSSRPDFFKQFADSMSEASESAWQAVQIDSGIGRIEAATVEEFIPQMLNYDITEHVNFTKGCYTGQEVVARMHYRGIPKRRMYRASLPNSDAPAAGTAIFTPDSKQSVGNVVNSATTEDGSVVVLVVATVGGVENGLHVGAPDGPLLEVGELPYSLEKP